MTSVTQRHPFAKFRAEILSEALAICQGRPAGDLRHPVLVHLRGVIALKQGRVSLAAAYLEHAARLDPACAAIYRDLGDALLHSGRTEDSRAAYVRAIALSPGDAVSYAVYGRGLFLQKRYAEARAMYEQALRIAPGDPGLHGELGDVLLAEGRPHDALRCCRIAVDLAPDDPGARHRVGRCLLNLEEWDNALEEFNLGVSLEPARSDLHAGAGEALMRRGRIREASRAFHAALSLHPADVVAGCQFPLTLESLGLHKDAASAWMNLGLALLARRRFREAASALRQAIARQPESPRALIALARAHAALGEPGAAIERLEAALRLQPQHAQAHVDLGLVLQQDGRFERGWDELVWSHLPGNTSWRHVKQPLWDGAPLEGRTLLLWADKDLDDSETIQYLRYASLGNASDTTGGRVVVECDRELVPIARLVPGIDRVVATGGPLPPYDVHVPLRHCPALVKTLRRVHVATPYLAVPEDRQQAWSRTLAHRERPLIGLAWSGSLDARDTALVPVPLRAFAPLAAVTGVRFISLQLGPYAHELLAPPAGLEIESYLDDRSSIGGLAALIAHLDVIVTVPSRVAHLAGALAKPAWILLPEHARWPWPFEGSRTPWYPSMRLFRATGPNQCRDAIEAVRDALVETLGASAMSSSLRQPA